eukprot:5555838-Amphidinium_carterae.1
MSSLLCLNMPRASFHIPMLESFVVTLPTLGWVLLALKHHSWNSSCIRLSCNLSELLQLMAFYR